MGMSTWSDSVASGIGAPGSNASGTYQASPTRPVGIGFPMEQMEDQINPLMLPPELLPPEPAALPVQMPVDVGMGGGKSAASPMMIPPGVSPMQGTRPIGIGLPYETAPGTVSLPGGMNINLMGGQVAAPEAIAARSPAAVKNVAPMIAQRSPAPVRAQAPAVAQRSPAATKPANLAQARSIKRTPVAKQHTPINRRLTM